MSIFHNCANLNPVLTCHVTILNNSHSSSMCISNINTVTLIICYNFEIMMSVSVL